MTGSQPPRTFDDLEGIEEVDVKTAATKTRMSEEAIRIAIRSGELLARVPRPHREMKRCGRGQGYRIKVKDLEAWYFGPQEQ